MKRYKIMGWMLSLLLAGNMLNAQVTTDSLSIYLLEAEANNPQLKAQFYKAAAGKEKIAQAGVLQDPELSAGIYVKPMETLMGDQVAEISLMQMFPWFGTLKAMREEASHMSRMEQEAYNSLRQDINYEVKKSYYSLYALQQEISQTIRSIELLRGVEQAAISRYGSGVSGSAASANNQPQPSGASASTVLPSSGMSGMSMGGTTATSTPSSASTGSMSGMPGGMDAMPAGNTLSDVLRIQIERTELENTLLTLQDRLSTEQFAFNLLLNRKGDTPVSLPESLDLAGIETDEAVLSELIADNNPMLKMYEAETAANEAELKMAKKMSLPMIGLGIEYMPMKKSANPMVMGDMNGTSMVMPMVSLTLPLYRSKYKAEQREIKFKRQAIESNAQNTENLLQTEAKEAVRLYKDAVRRVALYKKQQQLSERSLTLLLSLYATSGSNIDEVLRAEQQLLDFNIKTATALADSHTAKAWIEKLTTK